MAFVAITSAEIATGEPTSTLTATKIKDNFDDHETRISGNESSVGTFAPIRFLVNGDSFRLGSLDGLVHERVNFDLTLSAARIVLLELGPAPGGTITVDCEFKRGVSAFATIFSSLPSTSTTTQFTVRSGTLSTTSLLAGDILRVNLDSAMSDLFSWVLELDYTV